MAVSRLGADTGLEPSSADKGAGWIAHVPIKNATYTLAAQNKNKVTALLMQIL